MATYVWRNRLISAFLAPPNLLTAAKCDAMSACHFGFWRQPSRFLFAKCMNVDPAGSQPYGVQAGAGVTRFLEVSFTSEEENDRTGGSTPHFRIQTAGNRSALTRQLLE